MDLDRLNSLIKKYFGLEKRVKETEDEYTNICLFDLGEINRRLIIFIYYKNKYFSKEMKESEVKYFNDHCTKYLKIKI